MKKSHLIFLLCLLFCGQMLAQKPVLTKPTVFENVDVATGIIKRQPAAPLEPCLIIGTENYRLLEIENIHWDTDASTLLSIISANEVLPPDPLPQLPNVFNIVEISLNHPANFEEYEFNISVEQTNSVNDVFILFIDKSVTTNTNNGAKGIKGFTIVNNSFGINFGGGVATVVPVQTVDGVPCITIHTQVKQVSLANGDTCSLSDETVNRCN